MGSDFRTISVRDSDPSPPIRSFPEVHDMAAKALLQFDPPIMTLVLNDPDRRNALSKRLFEDLEQCLDDVEATIDAGTGHVLRIRGEGPAFCAGFDLNAMATEGALPSFLKRLGGICRRLRSMAAVVVAEVHGPAVAGGCALVSACDVVLAGPDATFGYPVHRLGISPAVSMPTLVPAVESGGARKMMLGGRLLDAATAKRLGLVHHLFDDREALAAGTNGLITRLGAMDPVTLGATKAYLNELDETSNDDLFARTLEASVRCGESEEAIRMIAAMHDRS